MLDIHLAPVPHDHHGQILGIGQVQLIQKRLIPADDLLGAGIKRKTELVLQFQTIVFMIHDPGHCPCLPRRFSL